MQALVEAAQLDPAKFDEGRSSEGCNESFGGGRRAAIIPLNIETNGHRKGYGQAGDTPQLPMGG